MEAWRQARIELLNSSVFDEGEPGEGAMAWKNGDWIAPETLPRLDLSARLEREAKCFAEASGAVEE